MKDIKNEITKLLTDSGLRKEIAKLITNDIIKLAITNNKFNYTSVLEEIDKDLEKEREYCLNFIGTVENGKIKFNIKRELKSLDDRLKLVRHILKQNELFDLPY